MPFENHGLGRRLGRRTGTSLNAVFSSTVASGRKMMELTTLNAVWATAMLAAIVPLRELPGRQEIHQDPYQPSSTHG